MDIVKKLISDLVIDEKVDLLVLKQFKTHHWMAFRNLFILNKLSPQLLSLILKPLPQGPLKEKIQFFHKHYSFEIIKENHILNREWKRVFAALKEQAIEPVFLKGHLLAQEGRDRVTRDLDILGQASELPRMIKIMEAMGYEFVSSRIVRYFTPKERKNVLSTISWYNEFHFFSNKTGLLIEFHTNLFPRARIYPENMEVFWAKQTLIFKNTDVYEEAGLRYRILCLEMQVIQAAVIINVKRSPAKLTFSLRDLLDLKNLCTKELSWSKLEELAETFQVKYHLFSALALLNRFIKGVVPQQILLSWRKALKPRELFMYHLHKRCMKKLLEYNALFAWIYRFLSIFLLGKKGPFREKLEFLRKMFLPSRWRIAEDYGFSKDNRYLVFYYYFLPIRNLMILLKKLFGLKEEVKK